MVEWFVVFVKRNFGLLFLMFEGYTILSCDIKIQDVIRSSRHAKNTSSKIYE